MGGARGARPPELSELTRAQDRLTFIYLEHCSVHRDANAITATDKRGVIHIPAATLGALLLGPGTRVSHQAMVLLAESGATTVWVGEEGVRYYGHGRSLTLNSTLLLAQAKMVSTTRSRLKVAREMYAMRFPGEELDGLSLQQLRGREGVRVRRSYLAEAARTQVEWKRRDYSVEDFDESDTVNKALSAANTALYGVVHSVIVALGCAPGLGFVHTGHVRSFVFDIADLYKAEITIPMAFDIAAEEPPDVATAARRRVRDMMRGGKFMERVVRDIRHLLLPNDAEVDVGYDEVLGSEGDVVQLWDGDRGVVSGGTSYGGGDIA